MADLSLWQEAAVALDEYACGGSKGRGKRDPVYLSVVENRDGPQVAWDRYSSCGDRAHWRMWRLGVRERFVNREERTPLPNDWHVGANIIELHNVSHGAPCMRDARGFATRPGPDWIPEPGDELLIWNYGNDAHSLSVMSYDPIKREAYTANYGTAGMSLAEFPGAQCKTVPLVYKADDGWVCGKRKVQRVTKLEAVIPLITAKPNFKDIGGAYFFGTGEMLDALESIVP